MATFQLSGLPNLQIANSNAPQASDANTALAFIRQNNEDQRQGANNLGLQALQAVKDITQTYQQFQQQQKQAAFQKKMGAAFDAKDVDAMRKLTVDYPEQMQAIQQGMGFVDANKNQAIGSAAMALKLAAGQGPEAVQEALMKNADALGHVGINPEDAWQTYQQDPQQFNRYTDLIGLHALGPEKYFDVLDKQQGRDIQRGQLAETQRSNQMSDARGWANVDVARQNVALRKAELENKALDQQIARETNQEKLADLKQKRDMNQQKLEGAREQVRKAAINDYQRVQTITDGYDQMIEKAKSIQKNPYLWRDTGFAGLLPNLPGWEARNIDENIESLKSQVAMQTLSAMKELSANGASGLGNASNREYQGLQSSLASLSTRQSPAQFRRSLQRIIDHAETAKNRLGTSFKQSYPDFQHQEAQTPTHLSDDELVNKYLGGR
ncbi:phage DNA ejection protein [Sodalis sp.]|uniref:phage DNA ejection protein n=1 Tax=Sodalis sp. (in: enterobacteria) TaxID=1898979 RepID=UPI003872F5D2